MKKFTFRLFSVLIILLVVASCGSISSMQKKHNTVHYQPSPNPLETKADKVNITINSSIPPKYFKKNAVVFVQPVLQYEGGNVELKPIVLKGEKVQGEGIEVNYKNGARITYHDEIDYKPGMETAKILLNPVAYKAKQVNANDKTRQDALKNKDAISLGNVKVTEGINITSERVSIRGEVCFADHGYVKSAAKPEMALIYFPVNIATLNWNFKLNKEKETKNLTDHLTALVTEKSVPKQIVIDGWASPEGEESFNMGLSKRRAETTVKLVNSVLDEGLKARAKKEGIAATDIPNYLENAKKDIVITTNAWGEDWENFTTKVNESNIPDKNAIVNIVKSQKDPRKREQEIRNMTVLFKQLEDDVLPWLRRGEISFYYSATQKSDQEIGKIASLNPAQLSYEELMYAGYLNHNYATKLKIYKFATEHFGSEWSAWNNAGAVCLYMGNISEAQRYLNVAQKLAGTNPCVLNNLGLLSVATKDYDLATNYFNKAIQSGSNEAKANLPILSLKTGNYEKASEELTTSPCTYNLAFAQLMMGNTGNAIKTLDCCVDQTAEVYYLRAICYARLDDGQGLLENLKMACDMQPDYKSAAKADVEFKRFWNNLDFQNIVQ